MPLEEPLSTRVQENISAKVQENTFTLKSATVLESGSTVEPTTMVEECLVHVTPFI